MSRPKMIDCYGILGVAPDATLKDINTAYKKLALKHHPDKAKNDDESIDEFQKIQQAVETLRDPHRRRKHDAELQINRRVYPEEQAFFESTYTGWRPHNFSLFTMRYMNTMRSMSDRYMYSYGNSVHMNPNSEDSVEERLRSQKDRQDHTEFRERNNQQGERPEEMTREEAMRARVKRDEEELEEAGGEEDDEEPNGPQYVYYSSEEDDEDDEDEDEFDEEGAPFATQNGYEEEYEYEDDDEDDGYEGGAVFEDASYVDEDGIYSTDASVGHSAADHKTAYHTSSDSNSDAGMPCEDTERARFIRSWQEEFADAYSDTDDDQHSIFFDCSEPERFSDDEVSIVTQEEYHPTETSQPDREPEREPESEPQQDPITSFLNAKLSHPEGRYKAEDLHAELKGIVMESYCGWLENVRLTFPGAKPLTTGEHPKNCLHLGFWEKEYGQFECEVCHRWMPIYTLTCPGCGIKACAGCKFEHYNK